VQDGPVSVHVITTRHLPILDRLIPGAGGCLDVFSEMSSLVKQHRLDAVEFPNWEGVGALFSLWRSVPLIVRLSTSSRETQVIDAIPLTRTARWDVRRERWMALNADALVTHSEAHRQRMVEELGVNCDRIDLSPHGIRVFPDFQRPTRQPGDFTVVFLGRMEKRKGALDLLQAIPKVLHDVPDTRFVFIGTDRPHCPGGMTHDEYVRASFPDAIRARIHLLGRLSDEEVDRWLQTADLFVAPSLYESFGLIFLEAMRWGTPAVGTHAGGIPEIIDHDQTGVLVAPGNAEALAAAIRELLNDEPHRVALGKAGRRKVEAKFSVERMAERAETLYTRTVARWRAQHGLEPGAAGVGGNMADLPQRGCNRG
jgi:glycosyltransferase involved in cell wall biosynthesis